MIPCLFPRKLGRVPCGERRIHARVGRYSYAPLFG
jgi:hypothetical protein